MIRSLYNWTMKLAGHHHAGRVLAFISFIESSFFPIPPDTLLIPMVIEKREKAWNYAFVCTLASVLGAFLGYAVGMFFFEVIGQPIISLYGKAEEFRNLQAVFDKNGWWIVFTAGLTPFPFKVITIASGLFALNPLVFLIGCIVSRGMRFYAVAALLWKYGPPVRAFIDKHLGWLTVAFCLLLVGGYFLFKLFLH